MINRTNDDQRLAMATALWLQVQFRQQFVAVIAVGLAIVAVFLVFLTKRIGIIY